MARFLASLLVRCPVVLCPAVIIAQRVNPEARLYPYIVQQNKAQLVMLVEEKLMERALAVRIANALRAADAENRRPGVVPPQYNELERQLAAIAGPDASKIHMGRSNNDLGATAERMTLRPEALEILERMAKLRALLVELAAQNQDTIIPGFTHAVQAQPTTLAHQISAFLHGLERDEERLRQAYARIDLSPLGVAAFTNSGYGLNRDRLRELMGFSGLVENSYDAIMVSTVDSKVEFASAAALSALNIGRFTQQFLIQYSDSRPGLNLSDEVVGHSSIMPQKRNPSQAERVRVLCSSIIGDAFTVALTAHNTPFGEAKDIRIELLERAETVGAEMKRMLNLFTGFVASIRVNPERTLELVNADYSVMTELADTMMREAGVPFRIGHQTASELVTYARTMRKRPLDLTLAEFNAAYRRVAGEGAALPAPLNEEQFRRAMTPENMVKERKGVGGPQPAEVARMLNGHRARLAALQAWLKERNGALQAAEVKLEEEFARLR